MLCNVNVLIENQIIWYLLNFSSLWWLSPNLSQTVKANYYRPHPKDGKGTVFTGVCLSTPGKGGVRRSLVPYPFPGNTPVLPRRGTPVLAGLLPQSWLGGTQTGVPLTPDRKCHIQDTLHLLHFHAGGLSCSKHFSKNIVFSQWAFLLNLAYLEVDFYFLQS